MKRSKGAPKKMHGAQISVLAAAAISAWFISFTLILSGSIALTTGHYAAGAILYAHAIVSLTVAAVLCVRVSLSRHRQIIVAAVLHGQQPERPRVTSL